MVIRSAIQGLANGDAVKPSTWRGYIERIDKTPSDSVYSAQNTYGVGAKVIYNGYRYMCTSTVDTPEAFDFSKWTRISNDRFIVFVDAEDDFDSGNLTPNPAAVYLVEVQDAEGAVKYTRLASTGAVSIAIPAELVAVHENWAGRNIPIPVDMPDGELFSAMMSDTWEAAHAKDYEEQRSATGRRW